MLTFVNKLKAYGYATNVEELMEDPVFWDPNISNEEWDEWFYENLHILQGQTSLKRFVADGVECCR